MFAVCLRAFGLLFALVGTVVVPSVRGFGVRCVLRGLFLCCRSALVGLRVVLPFSGWGFVPLFFWRFAFTCVFPCTRPFVVSWRFCYVSC